MTLITVLGLAVTVWGIVTSLATLLQAEKIAKAHTARNVSAGFHEIRLVSFAITLGFAVATGNIFLIIPNLVGLFSSAATVATILHFHH